VINVNDANTVILQERGGVQFIPNGAVESMVLCGTPEEIPAYATRVRDYHVEDSLLSALGRHKRPRVEIDPICRASYLPLPRPFHPEVSEPSEPEGAPVSPSAGPSRPPEPTPSAVVSSGPVSPAPQASPTPR
jgi:hypothetical protein